MKHCDTCGKERTLCEGQCQECHQAELDACNCAECGKPQQECNCAGGPWIPGSFKL